jgi:thymidylate synthase ThyX
MTLRADPGAMWEIQEFARAVGKILEAKFPRTWNLYVEGKK